MCRPSNERASSDGENLRSFDRKRAGDLHPVAVGGLAEMAGQAGELIADLKTSLMANEQLRELGEQIEVEPYPPDERNRDDLLNIEFPWD